MTKDTRVIFDKDFYTLQAVFNSKKFSRLLNDFYEDMSEQGLPYPKDGFKSVKDRNNWSERTRAKGIYYEKIFDDIFKAFGLGKTKEKYTLGLMWYVYFGHKKAPIQFTQGKLVKVAEDKRSLKVTLTIFPWTKKEDLKDLWSNISQKQEKLLGYKKGERNREWTTFERDLRIYEIYLKLKRSGARPIIDKVIESPEFERVKADFKAPDSIDERVGSIISNCRSVLGKINLL